MDPSVVDQTDLANGFVAYLTSSGTLSWGVTMPTQYSNVVSVDFQSSGTNIAVAMDSSASLN